jgi:hypothetical protein
MAEKKADSEKDFNDWLESRGLTQEWDNGNEITKLVIETGYHTIP